ncbi:MAG: hypothetical protein LBS45_07770 [Synergistaceae bacterium]|jgi:hypothetical protein|nr:hypothetical protein [Synergistaceae bacterium]
MSESWIDRSWKDVLKENLDDAISFFMPGLAELRDYSAKPRVADPERPAIGGKSNKGKRISDLCISMPLKDGGESRAIFMVEQQHEDDDTLPLRIFQSYYRASDEYALPVTSLAIYTGKTEPIDAYVREWQGTSVYFKYNVYSVNKADGYELKRDARDFALPVLAAKRMLEAGGKAAKRGEYSLELLERIGERNFDGEKAWSFQKFAYRLFQIDKDDIDPKVKGVWKMQFRPIDEVVKDIHIRDAKEEKALEVARNFLNMGLPLDQIAQGTGLSVEEISALR